MTVVRSEFNVEVLGKSLSFSMLFFVIMKTTCALKNVEKMSATKTKGVTKRKGGKVAVKLTKKIRKMSSASEDDNVEQPKSVVTLKKEKANKKSRKVIGSKQKIDGKTESTELIVASLFTAINMLELVIITLEKETCSQA